MQRTGRADRLNARFHRVGGTGAMFDMPKVLSLLEAFFKAAKNEIADAKGQTAALAASIDERFATFQATAAGADFDAKVKAALQDVFPNLDFSALEDLIKEFEAGITPLNVASAVGTAAQIGGAVASVVTGVDVSGIVTAITAATGVASNIVQAATQAHADAVGAGSTTAVAISASKEAATTAGASASTANALSSVIATTVQVQKTTSASVAQVAAAAVAHDDQTDENNVALPGTDPVAAAYHAATDKGADEATASTIANAVAAMAPTTVAS